MITALLLLFFNVNKPESTLQPLEMTTSFEVPTGRYYQTNGIYHLDMTGTSRLVLPFKKFPDNIFEYQLLVIDGLVSNQAVNLYITAQLLHGQNQTPLPFKQKLISHQQSINTLSEPWQSATKISDLALVIETEIALGFGDKFNSQVSWQSIRFTDNKQFSQIDKLLSEALSFVPLNYSSINIYNGENLTIYKSMLIWLGVWLFITVLIFIIIKPPAIHLLVSIALAWLFATLIFGHNFSRQISFNQQRFADNNPYLNRLDQELQDMANRVDETIRAQSDHPSGSKILIFGGENFNKKRLNYHLLQYNVGITGHYKNLLKIAGQANSFAILLPPYNKICQPDNKNQYAIIPDVLLKTPQFCLMQL